METPIKIKKSTMRNFLDVWDNLSDTGPNDWEEFLELDHGSGNQEDKVDDVFDFIQQLRVWADYND